LTLTLPALAMGEPVRALRLSSDWSAATAALTYLPRGIQMSEHRAKHRGNLKDLDCVWIDRRRYSEPAVFSVRLGGGRGPVITSNLSEK
jgi:hypothetical protein